MAGQKKAGAGWSRWTHREATAFRRAVGEAVGMPFDDYVTKLAEERIEAWRSGHAAARHRMDWSAVSEAIGVDSKRCASRLNTEVDWVVFGRGATRAECSAKRAAWEAEAREAVPASAIRRPPSLGLEDSLRSRREDERSQRDAAIGDAERLERQAASADSDIAAARAEADRRVAEIIRLAAEAEHQAKECRARAAACTARIEAIDLLIGSDPAPPPAPLAPEPPRPTIGEAAALMVEAYHAAKAADGAVRAPASVWLADYLAKHSDRHFTTEQLAFEALKQGVGSSLSDAKARVVNALKRCHKAGIISRRDSGRGPTWRICKGQSGATLAVVA